MWRALIFALLLMSGCVTDAPQKANTVESADTKQPPISLQTMQGLVAFAAKDRVCRLIVAKALHEALLPYKDDPPNTPIPRVHSYDLLPGEIPFYTCIYEMAANVSACDATSADLRTFKTLFDSDPRLNGAVSFDQVLAEIDKNCGDKKNNALHERIKSWPKYKLNHCGKYRDFPALIAEVIHTPINKRLTVNSSEREWEAANDCRAIQGWAFAHSGHCELLEVNTKSLKAELERAKRTAAALEKAKREVAELEHSKKDRKEMNDFDVIEITGMPTGNTQRIPNFKSLDIEEYYCPDSFKQWQLLHQ